MQGLQFLVTNFKPLIFHINSTLLEPAGQICESFVYEIPSIEYLDEIYEPECKATIDLTFSNGGSGFIFISGYAKCSFKTTCSRCLGETIYDINADVEGYVLLRDDAELPEDVEKSECIILTGDKRIDLSELIYSSILLELPLNPICSENCINDNISDEATSEQNNTYMPFKDLKSKL